jgi:surfeit locus 1 family protein
LSARARAWLVLLATVIGVAVTARLGYWQLSRAHQKLERQAQIDARGQLPPLSVAALARDAPAAPGQYYRRIRLEGQWVGDDTVFLDNRQMDGRPGFFVVTPLRLAGEPAAVLVQRGWVARDPSVRTRLPALSTPAGTVRIEGVIAPPPARLYQFATEASGPIRQNLDIAAYARETGLRLLPLSVLQIDSPTTTGDGLLRHWARPAVDVQTNYGYAFQWFAFCTLMAGLYVWFQLVRPRRQGRS